MSSSTPTTAKDALKEGKNPDAPEGVSAAPASVDKGKGKRTATDAELEEAATAKKEREAQDNDEEEEDSDDDDDEEEEGDEEEEDEEEEDDFEEIDPGAIRSRRTRGVKVDYTSAEALAKAGLQPGDEDDE